MTQSKRESSRRGRHRVDPRPERRTGSLKVSEFSDAADLTAREAARAVAAGTFIVMRTATVVTVFANPMHKRTVDDLDLLLDHADEPYSLKIPDQKRAERWVILSSVDASLLDLMPSAPLTLVARTRHEQAARLARALHAPDPSRMAVQIYGTNDEHRLAAAVGIPMLSPAVPTGSGYAQSEDDVVDILRDRATDTGVHASVIVIRTRHVSAERPSTVLESTRRNPDMSSPFRVHRAGDLDLRRATRAANTIYTPSNIEDWT